jgi:geranylgeranyl reductase family protein
MAILFFEFRVIKMTSENKISEYDVIVVGGGPAGSTAAFLLSQAGYEVLLVDKAKFPRKKLCGGLITEKTLNLIQKLFDFSLDKLKKDDVIDYVSDSYQIYFKNKQITTNHLEGKFHLIKRDVYDNYLLQTVKQKGVEVLEKTKVIDIDFKKNIIKTKRDKKYKSNYIIAADGVNSIIKNKILMERNLKNNSYIVNNKAMTIETEVSKEKLPFDLEGPILYFGVINWGYGWVFPKKDTAVIGLGGLTNHNKDLKKVFKEYLKLLKLDKYSLEIKGWPLPFGNYLDRPSYKNTFLLGDAANLVDPLTGEGLCYAHKSAQIVSQVIIENQKDTKMISNIYNERINEEIISKLKKAKFYRSILWASPKMINKILVSIGAKYFHKKITNIIQGYSMF